MTTTQAVEMSVTVNNSPTQDYIHPDDHTLNLLILPIFNFKIISRRPKLFKFSIQNPVKKIKIHVNVQYAHYLLMCRDVIFSLRVMK